MHKIGIIVMGALLGALFIFSGIIKLYPIELFELKLVDYRLATWNLAPYIARVIITLEIMLGIFFLTRLHSPKIIINWALVIIGLFTCFLVFYYFRYGNDTNCQCFGSLFPMTTLQSIEKNVFIIGLLILYKNMPEILVPRLFKRKWVLPCLLFTAIITTVIMVNPPIKISGYHSLTRLHKGDKFPEITGVAIPKNQPTLIAVVSATCPHCIQAGVKLTVMQHVNNFQNVIYLIKGDSLQISQYFERIGASAPKHHQISVNELIEITGGSVPQIFYIKKGKVAKSYDNLSFIQENFSSLKN